MRIFLEGSSEDEFMAKLCSLLFDKLQEILPNSPVENELLTREQTAEMLSISLMTLHNWTQYGYLTPVRIGRRVYYRKSDILKNLN